MSNKQLGIALVVVAIIAIGSYFRGTKTVVQQVGSQVGPVHQDGQEFLGGSYKGKVNATSSSLATHTLVATDLATNGFFYDTIVFTKTGAIATTTWTLVASSSLSNVLPLIGQRAEVCFDVATSTQSNSGLTLVAGAGWDLETASTTESLSIEAGSLGCLHIERTGTSTTPFGFRAGLMQYRQLAE